MRSMLVYVEVLEDMIGARLTLVKGALIFGNRRLVMLTQFAYFLFITLELWLNNIITLILIKNIFLNLTMTIFNL